VATLFTIISIVLAVTGSVYTALTGLRQLLREKVRKQRESQDFCAKEIRERGNHNERRMGTVASGICFTSTFFWNFAASLPIVILLVYSFSTSYEVYGLYADQHPTLAEETIDIEPSSENMDAIEIASCCNRHMKYMWWITTLDIICLPTMGFAFLGLFCGDWWLRNIYGGIEDRGDVSIEPQVISKQ